MPENKKYTIVIKSNRVEVSEAVYRAYHKEREAERYQKKLEQEQLRKLNIAFDALTVEERLLIHELFSMEKVSEYWPESLVFPAFMVWI